MFMINATHVAIASAHTCKDMLQLEISLVQRRTINLYQVEQLTYTNAFSIHNTSFKKGIFGTKTFLI